MGVAGAVSLGIVERNIYEIAIFIRLKVAKFMVGAHVDSAGAVVGKHRAYCLVVWYGKMFPAVTIESEQSGVVCNVNLSVKVLGAAPILETGIICRRIIVGDNGHKRSRRHRSCRHYYIYKECRERNK